MIERTRLKNRLFYLEWFCSEEVPSFFPSHTSRHFSTCKAAGSVDAVAVAVVAVAVVVVAVAVVDVLCSRGYWLLR